MQFCFYFCNKYTYLYSYIYSYNSRTVTYMLEMQWNIFFSMISFRIFCRRIYLMLYILMDLVPSEFLSVKCFKFFHVTTHFAHILRPDCTKNEQKIYIFGRNKKNKQLIITIRMQPNFMRLKVKTWKKVDFRVYNAYKVPVSSYNTNTILTYFR